MISNILCDFTCSIHIILGTLKYCDNMGRFKILNAMCVGVGAC